MYQTALLVFQHTTQPGRFETSRLVSSSMVSRGVVGKSTFISDTCNLLIVSLLINTWFVVSGVSCQNASLAFECHTTHPNLKHVGKHGLPNGSLASSHTIYTKTSVVLFSWPNILGAGLCKLGRSSGALSGCNRPCQLPRRCKLYSPLAYQDPLACLICLLATH